MPFLGLDVSNWINVGILLMAGASAVIAVSQARAAAESVRAAREIAAEIRRQLETAESQLAGQLQELAQRAEENAYPLVPRVSIRVDPVENPEYVGASVSLLNLGKTPLEILQISLDGKRIEFEEAAFTEDVRRSIAVIPPRDSSVILQSTRPRTSFRKKRAPKFSSNVVEVKVRHSLDELAAYSIYFDAVSESDVYLRAGEPEIIRSPYEEW